MIPLDTAEARDCLRSARIQAEQTRRRIDHLGRLREIERARLSRLEAECAWLADRVQATVSDAPPMAWRVSHRADPASRDIADRHYNRQKIGTPQFVPPGRCLVLRAETRTGRALWVTSWPFAEYVKHAWAGAWICSAFRNEGAGLASDMIRQAVAATCDRYGAPPPQGLVTFLDRRRVRPIRVRGVETWGRTWKLAGFRECGETKGGLLAMRLRPEDMPAPRSALRTQGDLFPGHFLAVSDAPTTDAQEARV